MTQWAGGKPGRRTALGCRGFAEGDNPPVHIRSTAPVIDTVRPISFLRSRECEGVRMQRLPATRGSMTAEWALTLPSVMIALAVILSGISAVVDQNRLQHAAADGVRLLSLGVDEGRMTDHVVQLVGSADLSVRITRDSVRSLACVHLSRGERSGLPGLFSVAHDTHSCGLVVDTGS